MADLKRTRRVIFNESDFSITNSPISAFCRTYCQGICNAFNREFGTNYTPEQFSSQYATSQAWGFPLFDYDGSVSDNYYFVISGSGNNNKLGMGIRLKENDETITDLVQPAVNLYTGSSSYLNLPFYSNNYAYNSKIYNGFLIFSPIPNGYSFGGLCYTGTDSSVKEDIQNNGVPAETFLFQKVSDYSGNTYTGILKFESAGNTGINALSYVVDGLFKTKKIYPYEIQAQLSSADRDETIACRIMDKFVKFDIYICSIKNTYGNIKDFYTISNHTGSENPLVNIYNKNDNKYITTLPTVTRSEKWAMLIKGEINKEPPQASSWVLRTTPSDTQLSLFASDKDTIHRTYYSGSGTVYHHDIYNENGWSTLPDIEDARGFGQYLNIVFNGILWWSGISVINGTRTLTNTDISPDYIVIPNSDTYSAISLYIYNNCIHMLFGLRNGRPYHYKYDGTSMVFITRDDFPTGLTVGRNGTECNGYLYYTDGKKIYRFNDVEWSFFSDVPVEVTANTSQTCGLIENRGFLHYFHDNPAYLTLRHFYYNEQTNSWIELQDNGIPYIEGVIYPNNISTTLMNYKNKINMAVASGTKRRILYLK